MEKSSKIIAAVAAILGAITIVIGAFGAHVLEDKLEASSLATFETAVRYQMFHVLALLLLGLTKSISLSTKKWVAMFFYFGLLIFCGLLYVLAIKSLLNFDVSFLGAIVPVGGLLFIVGWSRLAYGLLTSK